MIENHSYFKHKRKPFRGQRGQIIVEYVLLMVIAVTAALLIGNLMVSRNADSPGFLIAKWVRMSAVIGEDLADEPNAAP